MWPWASGSVPQFPLLLEEDRDGTCFQEFLQAVTENPARWPGPRGGRETSVTVSVPALPAPLLGT